MSLFHDDEHGPTEPIPGLPEALPDGEKILWQGRPDTMGLLIGALRLRWIAAYIVGMTAWRLFRGIEGGAATSELAGIVGVSVIAALAGTAVLWVIARAMSHAAIFTLTSHRVVLRYGVAIRKYVNAPFAQMASAQLKRNGRRVGDIVLQLEGPGQIGYFHLWPFARPLRLRKARPMLRAVKDPETIASLLASAVQAYAPQTTRIDAPVPESRDRPEQPAGSMDALGAT